MGPCGATMAEEERWQKNYNTLEIGPLDKTQMINVTDSCMMSIESDHMEGLQYVENMRLCRCHYIEEKWKDWSTRKFTKKHAGNNFMWEYHRQRHYCFASFKKTQVFVVK